VSTFCSHSLRYVPSTIDNGERSIVALQTVVSHNLEVLQEGCVFSLSDERNNKQLGWSTEQQGVPWVCLQLQPNTCYNTSTVSRVVATLMKHRRYLILNLAR